MFMYIYIYIHMYTYTPTYIYIYIYICVYTHRCSRIVVPPEDLRDVFEPLLLGGLVLHPVSVRRFPSFRTQPLENLSRHLWKKRFLSNPAPGENLLNACFLLLFVRESGVPAFFVRARPGEGRGAECTRGNQRLPLVHLAARPFPPSPPACLWY